MTTKTELAAQPGVEILIPLNKLKKSPENARKTPHDQAPIEALAASIAHKGMLQNLVVQLEIKADGSVTGYYLVMAGESRRLAQELRAMRTGPLRRGCRARSIRDQPRRERRPHRMHPADQFEAFRALNEERG